MAGTIKRKIKFDDVEVIHAYLMNRHFFKTDAEKGDFLAIAYEMDFEQVISTVKLNERAESYLFLHYEKGITQREISEMFGTTQQAVQQSLQRSLKKFERAFHSFYLKRENKVKIKQIQSA
ncbi:sigma factor-like helix-turn-helix DNA-binding protein [Jeotgalicoccus halotolerans]|uniref:RNA polymerase sigma factor (Sigma-70 family) n=1 Tax=Jeotgalicoccus halotolerans TaxID=157227 RepID=A0A3E0AVQ2_9STAP|nr:sigma factor-like helix-turn-helix DNA-binding protein [Jeotgalicoccus halotolerans]REG23798.1 RNA polymerase sigma factor (sigma-70 family) [Jeotgalicoccus halotolerans]